MRRLESLWNSYWIQISVLAVLAIIFGFMTAQGDSRAWLVAGGVTIATFIFFGPVAWSVRSRIPVEHRPQFNSRLVPVIELLTILGIGGMLGYFARSSFEAELAGATTGLIVGVVMVLLVELAAVPGRLCSFLLR